MIKGVMFDFSGTLFRVEPTAGWLSAVAAEAGTAATAAELAVWAERLEEAGALPGGAPPVRLPEELAELWEARDLSAEDHRAVYTALTRGSGLPWPELVEPLYERHYTPAAWQPYPDTVSTLRALREREVPVAVVSNIGWDLRPVFRHHGVDGLVDAYVLSYEEGVQKPDAPIFTTACEALGLPPEAVLMVGDSREADGGAAALGCRVHFVEHLPVGERPDGLAEVLRLL
ncbi:hydrolase [Streptomyces narbonensis]|nr:hydrolase [Streptomyces narbonensis]